MAKHEVLHAADLLLVDAGYDACMKVLHYRSNFIGMLMCCGYADPADPDRDPALESTATSLSEGYAKMLFNVGQKVHVECGNADKSVAHVLSVLAEVSTILTDGGAVYTSWSDVAISYHHDAISFSREALIIIMALVHDVDEFNVGISPEAPTWVAAQSDTDHSALIGLDLVKLRERLRARDYGALWMRHCRLYPHLYTEHMRAKRIVSRHGLIRETSQDGEKGDAARMLDIGHLVFAVIAEHAARGEKLTRTQIVERVPKRDEDVYQILDNIGWPKGSNSHGKG